MLKNTKVIRKQIGDKNMNKNDDEYKPIHGIEKLKDYVIEHVMERNRCLVIGSSKMIDQFAKDCRVPIDVVMADLSDFDGKIVAEPMRIFNKRSKEILLLGMANKTKMINVITLGMTKDVDKAKDLIAVELIKEKCRGGYRFSADSRCAGTKEEKIAMISSLFRIPDKETMNEMETSKKLMKGEFVIEVDKSASNADVILTEPSIEHIENGDNFRSETFRDALGIDEDREGELIDLSIKFFGKAVGVEKLSEAEEVSNMDHDLFLSLLEKEKGTNITEKLFVAFHQGMIMQEFIDQHGERFEHLENDTNERLKQIGKRHACEIRKSDTILKIEDLDNLSLKEKLKACFWSGFYNQEFYKSFGQQ